MMLGHRDLGYKPLRHMDDDFVQELEEHLSDTTYFGTDASALLQAPNDSQAAEVDGAEFFDLSDVEAIPSEALLDNLLRARADNHIELKGKDQRHPLSFNARTFGDGLTKALIATSYQVDQQRREDNDLAAPAKRLLEAKNKVNAAIKTLDKFRDHDELNIGEIEYKAKKLRDALNQLFQELEEIRQHP